MYIYPDNLKAAPMLFLWRLKDLAVIGISALISVFAMAQTGFTIPLIATIVYGFLAIRFEDTSILDFIKYAVKYFCGAAGISVENLAGLLKTVVV